MRILGHPIRLLFTTSLVLLSSWALGLESVAITEYMADPGGNSALYEWVELYNYGDVSVTMTNWYLRDGDTDHMTFPPGATIAPHNFLILARNKSAFQDRWLGGVNSTSVLEYGILSGSGMAMSDTGADEVILMNASAQLVWQIAYGGDVSDTRATFYAMDNLASASRNHGTKAVPDINRSGTDSQTGTLGYEGNEFTTDPWAYYAGDQPDNDFGSPLRGAYSSADNPPAPPASWTLDVSGSGFPVNAGIRGLAIADQSLDRGDNSDVTGISPVLKLLRVAR